MAIERLSVVVTGASAGIGRAVALRFAREGARLTLIGRSAKALAEVKRESEALGAEAIARPLDVSDADAVGRAADEAMARWGGIDVWVNDAMVTMFAPVTAMSPDEFRRITEVTYLGYVHGTMAALHHMRGVNKGTIVQIGSALAYRAIPLQSAYCGAKFAIRGFTEALRSELIRDNSAIRLIEVHLPAVNTPQFNWARTVFKRRPQPLPPIFAPEAIAEHVYKAALNRPRAIWLGLPTLKIIAGSIAAPGWLDRYLAKSSYDSQTSEDPLPADYRDNLFESVTGHATGGRFNAEARRRVIAFNPSIVRFAAAAILAALIVLLLALT